MTAPKRRWFRWFRPPWLIAGLLAGFIFAWFDSIGVRDGVLPIEDWLWYGAVGLLAGVGVDLFTSRHRRPPESSTH
jgi:hypothetical protein